MKSTLAAILTIAFVSLLATTNESFAQAPDTVIVSAVPPGNLNTVISGDTTAAGQRNNPNRVYLLQQTGSVDTTYFISAPIYSNYNLTIIGKRNPTTGNLPVVEPYINPDNSVPSRYIQASSGVVTLKNLYLLATRTDGATSTSYAFYENGDSVVLYLDHCVLDNFNNANILDFNGSHCKLFVTNNEFRNIQAPFWQGGTIFWAEKGVPIDTAEFVNNTMFCVNRADFGSPGWFGYLLFDHNTVFLGCGGLLLAQQLVNARITNNIFYGTIVHGADSAYIKGGSANAAKQGFGIIMVDTLKGFTNPPYPGYTVTEAQRNVVVENNAYFWPQAVYNYWTAVTDTGAAHHPGLITPPKWMNEKTDSMFNNHAVWPGFVASGNDSVDPGFLATLTGPATDSLINFVNLIWSGKTIPAWRWYQNIADPNPLDPTNVFNWVPSTWVSYPTPENLRYSNGALQFAGTDGKALGDLNWFPEQLTSNPVAAPALVSPHNETAVPRKATLTWNPSVGATTYHLQVATDTVFSSVAADTTVSDTTVKLGTPLAATTKYYWHVEASNGVFNSAYSAPDSFTTGTGIDAVVETGGIPRQFALHQNYPNPFNPSTVISYDLPKAQTVTLKIYNVLGQEVLTLVNGKQNAGRYDVNFNAGRLSSGVYFYSLKTESFSSIRKMLLLK